MSGRQRNGGVLEASIWVIIILISLYLVIKYDLDQKAQDKIERDRATFTIPPTDEELKEIELY